MSAANVTVRPFAGMYRVQYQKAGDLVAYFCWCDTMEEVAALVASLEVPAA